MSDAESSSKLVDEPVGIFRAERDHMTSGEETLARGNNMADFLRNQKINIKEMTQDEFMHKYETYLKEKGENGKSEVNEEKENSHKEKDVSKYNSNKRVSTQFTDGNFKNIVLKFTTLSE